MKRCVLLGRNGQLGWELQRALAPLGEVIALDREGASSTHRGAIGASDVICGDFRQPEKLAAAVRALQPDVVVNAAAYTQVDRAEAEEDVARIVNAVAPGALAALCADLGAWLVHYSSDYVFDGKGTRPWTEEDATAPLSAYGRTKLEGEERIRTSQCRHLILRTSWVYAARGANFARTMLRLAADRDHLSVVEDQVGAPTGADLLADVTAHALRTIERNADLGGTYHVAASGQTSWYGYARLVIDSARARGWGVKITPDTIRPVPSSAYPTAARRPLNSRLACSKFEQAFALALPPWQFGVERLIEELAATWTRGEHA